MFVTRSLGTRVSYLSAYCKMQPPAFTGRCRPVSESKKQDERKIFLVSERQYKRASQSEQNLKWHMIFHAWQHVMFLSVWPSHSVTVKTVQTRIMKILTVGYHKLDSSFRILETVQDSAKVTINQL